MSAPFTVTTSWDDGHPLDKRLAELLSHHGLRGTFYVPLRNREGRETMAPRDIRSIGADFEIGGHTLDHVDLRSVSLAEATDQIESGKMRLEDLLGRQVAGFCYPRGSYSSAHKELVRKAGFSYARTVKNFCLGVGEDRFAMPTTLQFFPHDTWTYVRNLARGGATPSRIGAALRASGGGIGDRVRRLAEFAAAAGGCLHLWGHSWEIEEHDLWRELDESLRFLATLAAAPATNMEALAGPPS